MFTKDDFILCLSARTQDSTKATFTDESPYGAPNQERADNANYFQVAKLDESQALTFISDIDNTLPLSSLSYQFINPIDGGYRAFLFVTPLWAGATAYVTKVEVSGVITVHPNIVYHVGSTTWYRAIADNTDVEPSVTVGWETSWEIFDPTTFQTELLNDKIIVKVHDDLIAFRYEDCLVAVVDDKKDDVLCDHCSDLDDLLPVLKQEFLLDAACSSNWQSKTTEADLTITQATKKFCC